MKKFIIGLIVIVSFNSAKADTKASLNDVENYLNSLTTFEADFQQYVPNMPYSSGTFYLNRPKKFLWQYKIPHEQKLVSTGGRLFFHDPETEQTTQLPLNSGFAAILTKVPLSLSNDDFKIHDIKNENGVIAIKLSLNNGDNPNENYFLLKFTSNPIKLLSMSSTDDFGQGLSITFSNHKQGHNLNGKLFKFKPLLEEF